MTLEEQHAFEKVGPEIKIDQHGAPAIGRPSHYTPELGAAICERIAAGELLRKIVESDEMPTERTIYNWRGEHPDFEAKYQQAREQQAHGFYERAVHIAETSRNWKADAIKIDALKWAAARMLPKVYGDAPTPKFVSAKDRKPKAAPELGDMYAQGRACPPEERKASEFSDQYADRRM